MVYKSLKINTKYNHDWSDMVYIYDINVKLIKIIKRETKIGVDIYYIGYMYESEDESNTIKPFYATINRLLGHIQKIEGSSNRYLVVNTGNYKINNIFKRLWKYIENRIFDTGLWKLVEKEKKPLFDIGSLKLVEEEKQHLLGTDRDNKIKSYNKLRFSSNIDLPLNKILDFRMLTIHISYVI